MPAESSSPSSTTTFWNRPPGASPIMYPLDDFYTLAGRPLPFIAPVAGNAIPQPYQDLLVHHLDMTSTLEKFHGARIHLHILSSQQRDDFYYREVVLLLDGSNRPVEFGAIKMNLGLFPPAARQAILKGHLPLGRILHENGVSHASRPKAFIKVKSDDFINSALQLTGSHLLFGRRNTLLDPKQNSLAEIVEILPPVDGNADELSA